MKRHVLAVSLVLLSSVVMAKGKMSCGAERNVDDVMPHTEQTCVYASHSFKDAALSVFGTSLIKFRTYADIGTRKKIDHKRMNGMDMEQQTTWHHAKKVEISVCQEGTDACVHGMFERDGRNIRIVKTVM